MNDLTKNARDLRKNQTEAEKLLWSHLRNRQIKNLKFRRQHPIPPYIVDFICEETSLIIEADGGQHNKEIDKERDTFLKKEGYMILRFWNNEILENIDGVLIKIMEQTPLTQPSPQEEGSKRICIGKISSSHGVKGLVKITPYCEDTNLLNGDIYTDKSGNDTLNVTIKNPSGKYILAQIDGITSPEQAKQLKCSLYVPRETLPQIDDEDEFYIEDLTGLDVTSDNKTIGTVAAVQNFGAGDLLEIKPKSGATYFVPFQDNYVVNIDLKNSSIEIQNSDRFIIE